jgi:hypothetical protein
MISLPVPRVAPLFIASLIVVGLLSLFVVSESYDSAERDIHITTDIAAAAAGARVTPTEPRL